jgi:hypothetical protein
VHGPITPSYAARPRLCDLSYLREPFERRDGSVGYRCAAEPVDAYLRKGAAAEATPGRMCPREPSLQRGPRDGQGPRDTLRR